MNSTACCAPSVVHLASPWWRRAALGASDAVDALCAAWRRLAVEPRPQAMGPGERELRALDGLSAETLRDIGAPDWMVEHSLRRGPSAIEPAWWR